MDKFWYTLLIVLEVGILGSISSKEAKEGHAEIIEAIQQQQTIGHTITYEEDSLTRIWVDSMHIRIGFKEYYEQYRK